MSHVDVGIRLKEGDMIIRGTAVGKIENIDGDRVEVNVLGTRESVFKSPEELTEDLANTRHIQIIRSVPDN